MAKTLAIVFGIVFVLVGLLGFIDNPLVGEGGLFHTNLMHDLVHIVLGLVLLYVAYKATAKTGLTLKVIGAIYLVLAILGFFMIPDGGALIGAEMNGADHWLHIVLAIVLLGAGFMAKGKTIAAPGANPMM
jgi:hypothetical protein